MKINNPSLLLESLKPEAMEAIQSQIGSIDRFLGPQDTFTFTCNRTARCCRNRERDPIILSPYDVYSMCDHLEIDSREFADQYADQVIAAASQLPMMLLRSIETSSGQSRCSFLETNDCGVYDSRPLVCRMYPVGRLYDSNLESYFFLMKTADCCNADLGQEHTIEHWIESVDAQPFLTGKDQLNALFMEIDYGKYQETSHAAKGNLGEILYHIDIAANALMERRLLNDSLTAQDYANLGVQTARNYLADLGCLVNRS